MKFVNPSLFILLLTLTNCVKEPVASFEFDGLVNYNGIGFCFTGQTIQLKNTFEAAKYFTWEFPDGSISHEANPSYTIPVNSRELEQTITLTASNRLPVRPSKVQETYKLYISSIPTEYFTIQDVTRQPYLKFIYPLIPDSLYSFRFSEKSENPKYEGRVLFKGPFPTAGVYLISEGIVSVEVTKTGYYEEMRYKSKLQFGGTVNLTATSDNRLRLTFDQVKVSDTYGSEIYTSADLIY